MRAIVFDLDGTLLEFTRPYPAILEDAFRAVAGEVPEGWVETYQEAFFERFRACDPDPVRAAFAALDGPDPDRLASALLRSEAEAASPPPGTRSVLARLGGQYRLGVVTNGLPAWQRRKLRNNDLLEPFDAVVASYEAGAHKPDAAPFELLEQRLPADRYAMVGDADADVDGADGVGWVAHRYDGGGFEDLPDAIDW